MSIHDNLCCKCNQQSGCWLMHARNWEVSHVRAASQDATQQQQCLHPTTCQAWMSSATTHMHWPRMVGAHGDMAFNPQYSVRVMRCRTIAMHSCSHFLSSFFQSAHCNTLPAVVRNAAAITNSHNMFLRCVWALQELMQYQHALSTDDAAGTGKASVKVQQVLPSLWWSYGI